MPSFDVVSEVDKHELTSAVDQASRELANRFDFNGIDAKFELDDSVIAMLAPSDFELKQTLDILRARLTVRKIRGDKLRVTARKKDDLQLAIALLRKTELDVSLQFDNFRD
jgi:uncharacterized protein YajQ (UPF0234 family)